MLLYGKHFELQNIDYIFCWYFPMPTEYCCWKFVCQLICGMHAVIFSNATSKHKVFNSVGNEKNISLIIKLLTIIKIKIDKIKKNINQDIQSYKIKLSSDCVCLTCLLKLIKNKFTT